MTLKTVIELDEYICQAEETNVCCHLLWRVGSCISYSRQNQYCRYWKILAANRIAYLLRLYHLVFTSFNVLIEQVENFVFLYDNGLPTVDV